MKILLFIFSVAMLALLVARFVAPPWRGRLLNALKAVVTVGAFYLLLSHPVKLEDGSREIAWRLVMNQLGRIDATTFWIFCGAAAGIKFVGILASMYRWTILLRGQAIDLPFRHIFGSFLIGRFIGTFLPSTAGLDGYKLYDAARFSGRSVEVTATTALEKVMGFAGIFLTYLVALPFGVGIFGDMAGLVAGLTVPFCLALIAALLIVLWYPALVQWFITHVPIPGKARLEGLVLRIARSAAAYRDKKGLVLGALGLSFVVHFTTAAMYYFTALAISATGAEFWKITFGSSIQILATVLSPFTIAGEGIREAAQYLLLQNLIGPANAIISAALGFWAAEALTLAGAWFWWRRPSGYHPAWCRVDGQQVDYAEAAAQAASLETDEDRARRESWPATELPTFVQRLRLSGGFGLGAGIVFGLLMGIVESLVIAAGGFGEEAQVLWYGPLAYALVLGGLGLAGGLALAVLPMDEREVRGWTPSLVGLATFVPIGLAITVFRVKRDLYAEQMPPAPVLLAILAGFGALALVLFLLGPRLFRSRLGALVRPLPALVLLAVVIGAGAVGSRVAGPEPAASAAPPAVPDELAYRPNVILVMVDTLRADHLSCYGADDVDTPAMCSLAEEGAQFNAFSHASWTKPAAATLLTSLVPSTHGAMSKVAALPDAVDTVAEQLQQRGYATGGVVANINLAPSFNFQQGYDEYHYLAPDYIARAQESSSKLILYQIARKVWFKIKPGLRFGDFYQDAATVNRTAFDFLERHRDSRFFLFVHYMDAHDPYFEHPYNGKGVARVSTPNPDPSQAEELRRLYKGEIEYLDSHFAQLLDRLRELGIYDDTLVLLTADHGEEFHDHGGWWHGLTLYDEQIRVPLLIKWASGDQPVRGARTDYAVGLIDVAPTLLARAGAEIPDAMQGVDLAIDASARPVPNRYVLSEEDHEGNVLRSLRSQGWKLIEANPGNPRRLPERELFYVQNDGAELRNLIDQREDIAADLLEHAEAQEKLARSRAVGGAEATISASELEALRALGYAEE